MLSLALNIPKNARVLGVGRGQFHSGVSGLSYFRSSISVCPTTAATIYQFLFLHYLATAFLPCDCAVLIAPAGFWPRGPRRHPSSLRPKSANSNSFLVALKSKECTFALCYLPSISQSKTLLLLFNGCQALTANQMKC